MEGKVSVSAGAYNYVVFTYRTPSSNSGTMGNTQLFWSVNNSGFFEANSILFSPKKGLKYVSAVLDMNAKSYWNGTVNTLRIDPFQSGTTAWNTMFVYSITFCKTQEAASRASVEQAESANGVLHRIDESVLTSSAYSLDTYMLPYWDSSIIYNESVLPVDNADGKVDLKDVVAIDRFLAGGRNVTLDDASADVDGDIAVTLKDAVLISRFLAGGWNITLI